MTYRYTIAVITKIPDPRKGEAGNLAHAPALYVQDESVPVGPENNYIGTVKDFYDDGNLVGAYPMFMGPVFELGQVLFLNEYGRCLTSGLKPSKWFVECEEVETLDEAIALSRKVQGYEEES